MKFAKHISVSEKSFTFASSRESKAIFPVNTSLVASSYLSIKKVHMEIQIRLPVTTRLTSSISIWIQLSICVGNESKEKFSESNEKFVVNRDSEP